MATVECTIKTTAIFSEDFNERYLLRKVFKEEEDNRRCTIITLYPACKVVYTMDLTSILIQNALFSLGFTSYNAVNMTSKINPTSKEMSESISAENLEQIRKSAEEVAEQEQGAIIVAWGSAGVGNKAVQKKQLEILRVLKPYEDKVYMITDGKNKHLHPLVPSLRGGKWILEKFNFPELPEAQEDTPQEHVETGKKKRKNAKQQAQNAEQGAGQAKNDAQPEGEHKHSEHTEHVEKTHQKETA